MRRLISVAAMVGTLAASAIAAHHAYASSGPVPATVQVNGVTSGLTISIGSTNPGTGGNITDTYTSQSNMGGTVSVTCTQDVASASTTAPGSALSAVYTSVSTTKQVIYMFCMDRYTVKDDRGTGTGYHVTVQATQWKCTATASKNGCTVGTTTIPTSSFYMDVPQVACNGTEPCASHGAPPTIKMTTSVPIDTTSGVVVASAAQNTGMGTYVFTPRTDQCGSNQQCYNSSGVLLSGSAAAGQLGLYPPTTTKNGTYSSTLTESVISGP
jgi:hypothetical protein